MSEALWWCLGVCKIIFPTKKDWFTNRTTSNCSICHSWQRNDHMFCIYSPSFSLNSQHLDSLLQQLPSPYIILGDFNGHNIFWGGKNNDSRGELIENFLTKNDICIMNDKSYTYLSTSAKSFSSIDLSFCHPSLFVTHHSFLIIIGLWVKTNIIVITFLSSLNRTLFPPRTTIQSGN